VVSSVTNWSPFSEALPLRDVMDRLLEQSVLRPRQAGNGRSQQPAWRMPMDVYETPHEFVLRAWAPGIKPDELSITWDQGTLSIRGTIPNPYPDKQQAVWHARELYYGDVFATVSLPGTVDVDKAEASFDAGVLTLRLPKAEAARPKQIRVQQAG